MNKLLMAAMVSMVASLSVAEADAAVSAVSNNTMSAKPSTVAIAEKPVATVNLNVASAADIAKGLKGVGKKRADAIVAYRTANGGFKTMDDVLKVKGVGSAMLQLNAGRISLK